MRRLLPIWGIIVFISLGLIYTVDRRADQEYEAARVEFIEKSKTSARIDLQKLQFSIQLLYENIRTLAALPSIRAIDRQGLNLTDDARGTIQQIHNSTTASFHNSEFYIVPIDLDPNRIDPITLRPEEPILVMDELILHAGSKIYTAGRRSTPQAVKSAPYSGPPEIEIYEYRQLKQTAAWLQQNYPTADSIKDNDVPLISGPEVVTFDKHPSKKTNNGKDRAGIIFSAPFYDADGKIKGLVSATVLTSSLRDLLSADHFALINPGNSYVNLGKSARELGSSEEWINRGIPDPYLIYSEVIPLPTQDFRSPWYVWSGLSNDVFQTSVGVTVIDYYRRVSMAALVVIAIAAGICISIIMLNLGRTQRLNISLRESRDAAKRSEIEAQIASVNLKEMNEDITVLNMRLTAQAEELQNAQQDIVRKAKMAQLGSLVATVAHELRNPLGAARTTLFVLKKKLHGLEVDVRPQLARVDANIMRCDTIITELLDFSRSQRPTARETDLDSWLEGVLHEEAAKLPAELVLNCDLGLNGRKVEFDSSRMTRIIINLLSNASEAMLPNGALLPEMKNRTPQIDVSTKLVGRGVEIIVRDNGPGIPPHMIEKIREPLFTTKGFGVGLGISVVEKILELHSGGLEIDSIQGKGARFTVWIPLQQKEQKAA